MDELEDEIFADDNARDEDQAPAKDEDEYGVASEEDPSDSCADEEFKA